MKYILALLLLPLLAWASNSGAVSGKVIRYAFIDVAFEVDAAGNVQSLKTHKEENQILQTQLLEKFKGYRFNSRKHDGMAVPATIQAVVPMKAVQTVDGLVHLVFQKPIEQAVRISGKSLDYIAIEKLLQKNGVVFAVKINIRRDGTVAQSQVKTKGLKVSPEAVDLIKNTISTWHYVVDIEDGVPQEMTADIDIRFGLRFDPNMPPLSRPGLNAW